MHSWLRVLTTLLPALLLLCISVSTATPINSLDVSARSGLASIAHAEPQDNANTYGTDYEGLVLREAPTNDRKDSHGLVLRSPHLQAQAITTHALHPRHLSNIPGITYRFLEVHLFDPVVAQFKLLGDELDAAFASYQQSLTWIKSDHPPLFRLSLTLGSLQLNISCPNPMNVDRIREAVSIATFARKIFFAIWFRMAIWSWEGTAIVLVFGLVPQLQRGPNVIGGRLPGG